MPKRDNARRVNALQIFSLFAVGTVFAYGCVLRGMHGSLDEALPPRTVRETPLTIGPPDAPRDQDPSHFRGREKLVGMLLEMHSISEETLEAVPMWEDIARERGPPVILGTEKCAEFRERVPALDRRVAIAGMFSTGTNLLSQLLQHNCAIPEGVEKKGRKGGHGMDWQVPWGKHTPAIFRSTTRTKRDEGIPEENVLPVVTVRHPYDWMMSMCRHAYTAKWKRNAENCPNLYDGNGVTARFSPGDSHYSSLPAMWNDWNNHYYNATYPRLLVRFEDVVFYPKELSTSICQCAGGQIMTPKDNDSLFHYVIDSAINGGGHGKAKRNGLLDSWIKYGGPRDFSKFSKSDLEFSRLVVDRNLMAKFHWDFPP